jgi:pimeloyl-ACP methyl ester carboxylesterase
MKTRDVFLYVLLLKVVWLCYKKWKTRRLLLLSAAPRVVPVILIPGLGGSRLYDSQKNLKWCNWQGFFPHFTNNWRDALTVKYNPLSKEFEEAEYHSPYRTPHWQGGTFAPTADFGGTDGVGNVLSRSVKSSWQFQGILTAAAAMGYTDGVNMLGAPYDFRKITSPSVWREYCRSLKALVEHFGSSSKVVLLSHSMGSALLLTFLVLYLPKVMSPRKVAAWKETYIQRWVTVNGAFGGAGKALRSFLSGDNNGMGYICDTGCHDWYQPLLENASGVLWMLPHPQVFSSKAPIVTIGTSAYSAAEVPALLEKVSPLAAAAYRDTVVPLLTVDPPGVPVVCVTSTQPGTPVQCTYPDEALHFSAVTMTDERVYYAHESPHVQHMCGDGTVPYVSLMVPQRWMDQGAPVTFIRLNQENVAHTSILIEPEPVKVVMSLL